MKDITIISKGRKYYAASVGNYKCKLVIDENSEGLEPGTHALELEDISVRTKYGTDLIFKLTASVAETKAAGVCTLQHDRHNVDLVEASHRLGGRWDAQAKAWVFSGFVSAEVEGLDADYNDDQVIVELTYHDNAHGYQGPVRFCGYPLAIAFGRDSGAKICEGVAFIEGGCGSTGSMKNWYTYIKKGSVVRLSLGRALLKDVEQTKELTWKIWEKPPE